MRERWSLYKFSLFLGMKLCKVWVILNIWFICKIYEGEHWHIEQRNLSKYVFHVLVAKYCRFTLHGSSVQISSVPDFFSHNFGYYTILSSYDIVKDVNFQDNSSVHIVLILQLFIIRLSIIILLIIKNSLNKYLANLFLLLTEILREYDVFQELYF